MTPTKLPPCGIYVPVPTFFTAAPPAAAVPDAPLDLDAQCAHALLLARSGITGLVLLGSTGEAIALSDAERTQVIAAVRKALDAGGFPHYPLMAGTAAYGVEATIQQCTDAQAAGADYAMCLAPGFFAKQVTTDGMVAWYTAVAERSPLPILIYNYPGVTNGLTLPPALYTAMAHHANVVGAKLSHGDVSLLAQITHSTTPASAPDAFRVFTGLGQQLVPVLSVSGAGAIDGLAGIFPHVVVRLYEAYRQIETATPDHASHLKTALGELQGDVSRGEELLVKWGLVGIKEAIARELNIGVRDSTRLPLMGGMPAGAWDEFEPGFEKLRKVERMLRDHRTHVEQK